MVHRFADQCGRAVFQQGEYSPGIAAAVPDRCWPAARLAQDFDRQHEAKFSRAGRDGVGGWRAPVYFGRARNVLVDLLYPVRFCGGDDCAGILSWRARGQGAVRRVLVSLLRRFDAAEHAPLWRLHLASWDGGDFFLPGWGGILKKSRKRIADRLKN